MKFLQLFSLIPIVIFSNEQINPWQLATSKNSQLSKEAAFVKVHGYICIQSFEVVHVHVCLNGV